MSMGNGEDNITKEQSLSATLRDDEKMAYLGVGNEELDSLHFDSSSDRNKDTESTHDAENEVLRVPLLDGHASRQRRLVILRHSFHQVEIRVLNVPFAREEELLTIDLRRVRLYPRYLDLRLPSNQCLIRPMSDDRAYNFNFANLQDTLKFQQAITGYRTLFHQSGIQLHIRYASLLPKDRSFHASLQLWHPKVLKEYWELTPEDDRVPSLSEVPSLASTETASSVRIRPEEGLMLDQLGSPLILLVLSDRHTLETKSLLKIPLKLSTISVKRCYCRNSQKPCIHSTIESPGARLDAYQQEPSQDEGELNTAAFGLYQPENETKLTTPLKFSWIQLGFQNQEDKLRFELGFKSMQQLHMIKHRDRLKRLHVAISDTSISTRPQVPKVAKSAPPYPEQDEHRQYATLAPYVTEADISVSESFLNDIKGQGQRYNDSALGKAERTADPGAAEETEKRQKQPVRSTGSQMLEHKTLKNAQAVVGEKQQELRRVSKERHKTYFRNAIIPRGMLQPTTLDNEGKGLSSRDDRPPKASSEGQAVNPMLREVEQDTIMQDQEEAASMPTKDEKRNPDTQGDVRRKFDAGTKSYSGLALTRTEGSIFKRLGGLFPFSAAGLGYQAFTARAAFLGVNRSNVGREGTLPKGGKLVKFEAILRAIDRGQPRNRLCRKIKLFMVWKKELGSSPPPELWSASPDFGFIETAEASPFDRIKALFEIYSGQEWNWWPFEAPAKPLRRGEVRVWWKCTCGELRWVDVSPTLARNCRTVVKEALAAAQAKELANNTAIPPSEVTSNNLAQGEAAIPGSFPSSSAETPENTKTAGHSTLGDPESNSGARDSYILFCLYQESRIRHAQIQAAKCRTDEGFFESLRQEYRCLRGFWRHWLSPFQFDHCEFVRFTRFYVSELAKVGRDLPLDLLYQYNPRPPGPHDDPPITPHEFRRRFYSHFANPCGRGEALERIPKRTKRFQINLHVDGREDMWGLHVQLRPCFLIIIMWQVIITAGGWAFMGWWLSRHNGDLQTAAVPITLVLAAFMTLWVPLSDSMKVSL